MNIIEEGGVVKEGFNFYSLTDKASFGFKYRKDNTLYTFRYSKSKNYTSFMQRFIIKKTTYELEPNNVNKV